MLDISEETICSILKGQRLQEEQLPIYAAWQCKRVGSRPEIFSVQPAYEKYEATVWFLNLGA